MAITVIKTPQNYAPTKNPIVYTVKSTRSTIVYFDAEITEITSGAVISRCKYYVRPDYPSGVNIDLSSILDSYVKGEFKPYKSGFVDFFSKQIIFYNLKITERYMNPAGTEILTGEIQNFSYRAMKGELDTLTNYNFNRNHYFLGKVTKSYFMTTKPDRTVVNDFSEEGLYFMQDNTVTSIQVVYDFYNSAGWSIGSYQHIMLTGLDTYKIWRINCSPAYLKANITGIDFNAVTHFKVKITDLAFFERTETRTFIYEKLPCHLTPVNVYWENKFGCIDTYQFINPEMNQIVNRTMMKKNPYRMNEVGEYTDYSKPGSYSVFNIIDQILDATSDTTMRVWTRRLSDKETVWMSSIFTSRNYWIKADGELYVPVVLQETNWNMMKNRYMDEPNIKPFTFKFSDNYSADYKITTVPTTTPKPGGGGGGGGPGTPGGGGGSSSSTVPAGGFSTV